MTPRRGPLSTSNLPADIAGKQRSKELLFAVAGVQLFFYKAATFSLH